MDAALSASRPDPVPAPPVDPVAALLVEEDAVIRRLVARYVHFRPAHEDLVQDICLKALRRGEDLRDPVAAKGWLFQLVRTTCLDWLRSQMRRPDEDPRPETLEDHPARGELARGPMDQLLTKERVSSIRRALDDLPASQREVLLLRIDEGLDHEAIAERLGISRTAVEIRLCRGRSRLKEQLGSILEGDG